MIDETLSIKTGPVVRGSIPAVLVQTFEGLMGFRAAVYDEMLYHGSEAAEKRKELRRLDREIAEATLDLALFFKPDES